MKQIKLPVISGLLLFIMICGSSIALNAQSKPDSMATPVPDQLNTDAANFHYLKKAKRDVLGAVNYLKERTIQDQAPLAIDPLLQGKVAGLRATSFSGAPGSGALVHIRGISTINAGNAPLYIVDGIPVASARYKNTLSKYADINPLADINIEDIESITVLKDAHATAIYGARGSNGVVIIKTTTGTSGKTYLDFTGFTGVQTMPRQLDVLDANGYRNFILEKERFAGAGGRGLTEQEVNAQFPGIFNLNPQHPDFARYSNNTNWQEVITEPGTINNANLKLKGGDALAKYAFNVGYSKQNGIITDTKFERFNTRFNLDYKVSRKMRFYNSISYTRSDRKMQDEGNTYNTNPLLLSTIKAPFLTTFRKDREGQNLGRLDSVDFLARSNPMALINGVNSINNTNHILGNIFTEYEFIPGLTAKINLNADYFRLREARFTPSVGIQQVKNVVRYAAENNNVDLLLQNENTVNFARTFNQVHAINAVVGGGLIFLERSIKSARSINSPSDEFVSISSSNTANIDTAGSLAPNYKMASFFTSLNYTYADKYLFGLNVRADGSSRFSEDNRWGLFPSVAAAWRLSSESFMENSNFFNDLKLRMSLGRTGNHEMGDYSYKSFIVPANSNNFAGSRLGVLGDPNLKYETTTQVDVGFDAAILNGRLNFTADFYKKKTDNLLNYIYLPNVSGFTNYLTNGGSVQNMGVEFATEGQLVSGRNFSWVTNFNVAFNRNELLSLPKNQDIVQTGYGEFQTINRVGYGIGAFYGYKALGVYASDAEVNVKNGADNVNPFKGGDIIFQDVNKDGVIDESDKKVIGNSNPDVFGGFSNVFAYKNFDLNIFLDFSFGNQVYNGQRARLEAMSGYDNQSAVIENRWQQAGDQTDMPRFSHGDPTGNTRFSSRWVEDASYTRVKALTLGYNMPAGKRFKFVNSARIYLTAQNLLTFTDYKGYDPEIASVSLGNSYGVDYGSVPQLRSFILGVRLGL